ncbi:uncharacterized protein LOC118804547 isoform X3 [Colossoma macropomum]|uniref:uncharacterized protein LOC118804547 isoform X3 n=1 Tax=Colossoma macropomum TaxID=42526 RepID=UPI001864385F|nr:uncharacterized protein LOC118804547 isoform X3 [Colossoma macropomum]
MDKKTCGPGFSWDGLVKDCIQETQPVTGKRRSEPAAPPQLNGNTVSPALLEEREDPSLSCPHWNGKTEEVSVCEMGWGRGICEGKMEHGVPVPATELGDSALVTTKTVQQAEA